MNILLTGSGGFVGKNLTESLKNIRDGKDRTRNLKIGEILVLLNNLVKKCLEVLKFQGAWRFKNGYFLKMGIVNRPDP